MSTVSAALRAEQPRFGTYVLMTAAHNEEDFIEGTIRSVLAQTLLPQRWVIVSDNSTDRTDEIVGSYARQHTFIRSLHITRAPGRHFSAKVRALQQGLRLLEGVEYEFIGNVDADISLGPSYFEDLVAHFRKRPDLGLSAGFLYEDAAGGYRSVTINNVHDVFHGAQLVRRECYEQIDGYAVLTYGGEDWYAQTKARMKGWHVESIPKLKIFHNRHTSGGSSPLKNSFRQGRQDYSFGSDPLFEILKCMRRIPEKPYLGSALARLAGFIWPYICKEPRAVPEDFASFLRREQKERVSQLLNRGWSVLRSAGSMVRKRA